MDSRNWLELPPDVLSMICIKLGTIDILLGAQSVCSVWRKFSKEPHLYRIVDLRNHRGLYGIFDIKKMAIEAVNRNSGQLVEFSMEYATDEVLWSIIHRCNFLRCLRLALSNFLSEKVMIEMAKKIPQLEELELSHCSISTAVIEAFGNSCLQFKSFQLNRRGYKGPPYSDCDKQALAIANNMHELRHLDIFGNHLSDNGLRAILDGSPHLCSLDLKQCFNVRSLDHRHYLVEGDLRTRCVEGNIISKLPDDSTHGYEFGTSFETGEDYENYTENSESGDEFPHCDDGTLTMSFYNHYTM